MKGFWRIFFSVAGWVAIVVYIVVAARYCRREKSSVAVSSVRVRVLDSARQGVITPYMVGLWISRAGIEVRNKPVDQVDTRRIKELVGSRGFVRSADVYTDMNGHVNVDIRQRRPVARFHPEGGGGFYVTSDGWILPLQGHCTMYVPVVTGEFEPPFAEGYVGPWRTESAEKQKNIDENYIFFSKLINFVKFISDDPFWNAQIVQINVSEGPSSGLHGCRVEIVPRAGDHVVCLGSLDDVEAKLDKLMLFYRKALDYQGWDAVKYIDLSYDNQIVCRR